MFVKYKCWTLADSEISRDQMIVDFPVGESIPIEETSQGDGLSIGLEFLFGF